MNRPVFRVTRERLYEQIWQRPVRTVAAEYGISDVGLAKICKKLDVPRPTVGYWNRVQHGQSPPRIALPPRARDVPAEAEICGVVKTEPAASEGPTPAPPVVTVPKTLLHPHPTVRRIRTELDGQTVHNGALALVARRETMVRVTPACRHRALILLDALAKGLADRGHELVFGVAHEGRLTTYSLAAYVGEQAVEVSLYERTRQIAHVQTKSEIAAEARGRYVYVPRYDFPSTGILRLTIGGRYGVAHRSWSDGRRRALEVLLGEIVIGIERAAELLIERDRQWEAERRAAAEEARRRELAERRAKHARALEADLVQMTRAWRDAGDVRGFVAAVEEGTPPALWTERFAAWVSWAKGRADELDPLHEPEKIPKPIEPEVDVEGPGAELELSPAFRQPPGISSEWSHGPSGPRPGRG